MQKLICAGFKVYVLSTPVGHLFNFMLHEADKIKGKMLNISFKVAEPIPNHHHIFTDKAYTSIALARLLRAKSTYLTGSIKCNTKDLLYALSGNDNANPNAQMVQEPKQCPRGTFYGCQCGMMYVLWNDSKFITYCCQACLMLTATKITTP